MNIHYLKHVPFEGLGFIDNWVKNPEHKVTATKFYEDHKLPFVDICDMLIVMGGPMSVHDEHLYPWLTEEKKFIEKAIGKGKKVVGVCLGAQLIAEVLGAKVYPNKEKEIGWFPVKFMPENSELIKGFPQTETVLHWHGETFELPQGSRHIAKSDACRNQGFTYMDHVVALQFHLEMTSDSLNVMIENCKDDLKPSKFVQSQEQIRSIEFFDSNNKLMNQLLNSLAGMN
jgi:GMP synthase-like glutamine amidotransferase